MSSRAGFVLGCRAAELRGRLRHVYLENTFLLFQSPGSLVEVFEQPVIGGGTWMDECRELGKELVAELRDELRGFCAIPLLDTIGPLRDLSEAEKEALRQRMREDYRTVFQPATKADRLERLLGMLWTRTDVLIEEHRRAGADTDGVRARFSEVRAAAEELHLFLSTLPKGIWLWPDESV
jgi:hypothetical protein